jgi:hypothetical protein
MTPSSDYPKLISECMRWAETADSQDTFEAFVALAEIWRRIADHEQSGRKLNRSNEFGY